MVSALDKTVPPAVATARRWLERDRAENQVRDQQIRRLNNAYDAALYNLDAGSGETVMTRTLTDSTATAGQGSTPRFSEVPVPMVRAIVEDWKSIMAITPNYLCPPTSPGEEASERAADLREKIVSGIYWDSSLDMRIQEGAHYRSLHGAELLHCLPSPEDHRVRIDTRSSYRSYARLLNAQRDLMYMAWDWEELTDYVLEMWPQIEALLGPEDGVKKKGAKTSYPERITMTEWYDRTNRIVMVHDKWVDGMPWAEHKWGFVPGQVVPNIPGVGLWSQPDVVPAVHLSQLYAELLSMGVDGIFQTIYDVPILFDDNRVEKITVGTHEALQMSKDAHTGSLRSNVKIPETHLLLEVLERVARLGSGWPKTQSSEMDSPIISGKAFVAAQGPVAARAAIKLVTSAVCLEKVTGYAMRLYEHHFPNETISLMTVPSGVRTSVVADRNAVGGPFTFVPKRDINRNYLVRVNFPPGGADQYRATIEQLQLLEQGVISVETMRQNRPGIDPKAEEMRVDREHRKKATQAAEDQALMMQTQLALQAQAQAAMAPAAGPPAPAGEGVVQGGQQGPPGQQPGPVMGMAPAEAPARAAAGAGAMENQGRWERVTRQEVRIEVAAVKPIRGRVFLTGAIARMGFTTGLIEMRLTDMLDKATLTQKTSFGREGRLLIEEAPPNLERNEAVIEITPAA